jgi:hypothetical protein
MRLFMTPRHTPFLGLILLLSSSWALAHEGHGLPGAAHWHSTDVVGYIALALIGLVLWLSGRK